MKELFSPVLDGGNLMHYLLHQEADEDMEINLSDEVDTIIGAIKLGVHNEDEEHLLLHPKFRSKILESMIEIPHVEAELVTEKDGHKLRGKKTHLKQIMGKALEKMRD